MFSSFSRFNDKISDKFVTNKKSNREVRVIGREKFEVAYSKFFPMQEKTYSLDSNHGDLITK